MTTEKNAPSFRISDDSIATVKIHNPDEIYPLRRKELVDEINNRLGGNYKINPHDITCFRKVLNTDQNKNYYYKSKYGTSQYSYHFADKIVSEYENNGNIFHELREKYKNMIK